VVGYAPRVIRKGTMLILIAPPRLLSLDATPFLSLASQPTSAHGDGRVWSTEYAAANQRKFKRKAAQSKRKLPSRPELIYTFKFAYYAISHFLLNFPISL